MMQSFFKKMVYFQLDVSDAKSLPKAPEFQTLYISGGKKNKINKKYLNECFELINYLNKNLVLWFSLK